MDNISEDFKGFYKAIGELAEELYTSGNEDLGSPQRLRSEELNRKYEELRDLKYDIADKLEEALTLIEQASEDKE